MLRRLSCCTLLQVACCFLAAPSHAQQTLVIDMYPGPDNYGFGGADHTSVAFGGQLLYAGWPGTPPGKVLHTSDGTTTGTELVPNLSSAADDPRWMTPFGDKVLFCGHESGPGSVWSTDGTAAGTERLTPVGTGRCSWITPVGDLAFFLVDTGAWDALWRTDGTPQGTYLIGPDGNFNGDSGKLCRLGDSEIVFAFGNFTLWKSDGTAQGTVKIFDWPVSFDPAPDPDLFTPGGDLVYFAASTDDEGRELWRTDGTQAGTFLAKDIEPGLVGSRPKALGALSDGRAIVSTTFSGTWISDGTSTGTTLVDATLEPTHVVPVGDRAFLMASTIAITDGTPAGTEVLNSPQISYAGFYAGMGPRQIGDGPDVLFPATDFFGTFGTELYHADPRGVSKVLDIAPGNEDTNPGQFVRVGSQVFFSAYHPATGRELHTIDMALFGGWAVSQYGSGCALGTPPGLDAAGEAVLGGSLDFELDGAAPFAPTLLLASVVNSELDFGSGCTFYLGGFETIGSGSTDASGAFNATLPIPPLPALNGLAFYSQGLVVVPGGPLLGQAELSDAVEVVIGTD